MTDDGLLTILRGVIENGTRRLAWSREKVKRFRRQ